MEAMTEENKVSVGNYAGHIGEHLAFRLGAEEYGIEILKVQEIRGVDTITQIANTPDFIKGVINLRGRIVPIIDLRLKFKMGEQAYDRFTVVIILNLASRLIGVVVDGVSDVIDLKESDIRHLPDIVTSANTKHLSGIASIESRSIILVDMEKLMTSDEMKVMDATLH